MVQRQWTLDIVVLNRTSILERKHQMNWLDLGQKWTTLPKVFLKRTMYMDDSQHRVRINKEIKRMDWHLMKFWLVVIQTPTLVNLNQLLAIQYKVIQESFLRPVHLTKMLASKFNNKMYIKISKLLQVILTNSIIIHMLMVLEGMKYNNKFKNNSKDAEHNNPIIKTQREQVVSTWIQHFIQAIIIQWQILSEK